MSTLVTINSRFAHIDALRGIAALLVVCAHVCEVFVRLSPETEALGTGLYDIARMYDFGRIGVVIFFLISGFVICKSLKGDLATGTSQFVIRRFFRLYPAFWLSMALGLFSMWWLFDKPFEWRLVAANATMLPELLGSQSVIGLYWTLEVELIFYFLCWLLFLVRSLDRPLTLFLLSAFFAVLFVAPKFPFTPEDLRSALKEMPYNLSIMFFGGLLRHWSDDRTASISLGIRRIQVGWLASALALVVLAPALLIYAKGVVEHRDMLVRFASGYTLGFSIFIACHLFLKVKTGFMVRVGIASYSLYLLHPVVFYTLLWYLRNGAPQWLSTLHLSAYVAFTMLVSLGLSFATYRLVEKPAIDYAHKLASGPNRIPA